MTYAELTDVAQKEQDENARPELAGMPENLSEYDTIYFGYPIWWGNLPMVCYTFLESAAGELDGKVIKPFCTHEGSGDAGTRESIARSVPGAEVSDVLAIRGKTAHESGDEVSSAVQGWLGN